MKRWVFILVSIPLISGIDLRWCHACGHKTDAHEDVKSSQAAGSEEEANTLRDCCHGCKSCCGCRSRCDGSRCRCSHGTCRCNCNERPTAPPAAPDSRSNRSVDRSAQVSSSYRWSLAVGSPKEEAFPFEFDLRFTRFHTIPLYLSILTIRC